METNLCYVSGDCRGFAYRAQRVEHDRLCLYLWYYRSITQQTVRTFVMSWHKFSSITLDVHIIFLSKVCTYCYDRSHFFEYLSKNTQSILSYSRGISKGVWYSLEFWCTRAPAKQELSSLYVEIFLIYIATGMLAVWRARSSMPIHLRLSLQTWNTLAFIPWVCLCVKSLPRAVCWNCGAVE